MKAKTKAKTTATATTRHAVTPVDDVLPAASRRHVKRVRGRQRLPPPAARGRGFPRVYREREKRKRGEVGLRWRRAGACRHRFILEMHDPTAGRHHRDRSDYPNRSVGDGPTPSRASVTSGPSCHLSLPPSSWLSLEGEYINECHGQADD